MVENIFSLSRSFRRKTFPGDALSSSSQTFFISLSLSFFLLLFRSTTLLPLSFYHIKLRTSQTINFFSKSSLVHTFSRSLWELKRNFVVLIHLMRFKVWGPQRLFFYLLSVNFSVNQKQFTSGAPALNCFWDSSRSVSFMKPAFSCLAFQTYSCTKSKSTMKLPYLSDLHSQILCSRQLRSNCLQMISLCSHCLLLMHSS